MSKINPAQAAPVAKTTGNAAATNAPAAPAEKKVPKVSTNPAAVKAREKRHSRKAHPALYNAEGERVRLKSIPDDFDAKLHKPFARKDFDDEGLFFEIRARKCDDQAKKFRELADEARTVGKSTDKIAAKKLVAMQKKVAELKASLIATGMTEEQLADMLKQFEPKSDASKETAVPVK